MGPWKTLAVMLTLIVPQWREYRVKPIALDQS